MKKEIKVITNDPDHKHLNLVLTGQVERFAEINPQAVNLNGKPGDTLQAVVLVTPSEKYPFTIQALEKKFNTKIEATLIRPEKGSKSWRIKIKCRSDKVEDLFDEVILKTDSKVSPNLGIRVSAVFVENKKAK